MKIQRRDAIAGFIVVLFLLFIVFSALGMLLVLSTRGMKTARKSVGIVEIRGQILSPKRTVDILENYIADDNIPVIVLRLTTPGGGVSATQEIYDTVLKARSAGKKVFASMGAVAASGGYYIAAACDTVVATSSTITGSIGVIATFPDLTELYRKIGIDYNVAKSGKYKDTGSTSRKMTEDDRIHINELIMDIYDQFVIAVAEKRGLEPDFVRSVADGRVFTGRQAKELGLIDLLGTYQDAIDLAGVAAGIGKNPPVVKDVRDVFWERIFDGLTGLVMRGLAIPAPHFSYILSY